MGSRWIDATLHLDFSFLDSWVVTTRETIETCMFSFALCLLPLLAAASGELSCEADASFLQLPSLLIAPATSAPWNPGSETRARSSSGRFHEELPESPFHIDGTTYTSRYVCCCFFSTRSLTSILVCLLLCLRQARGQPVVVLLRTSLMGRRFEEPRT